MDFNSKASKKFSCHLHLRRAIYYCHLVLPNLPYPSKVLSPNSLYALPPSQQFCSMSPMEGMNKYGSSHDNEFIQELSTIPCFVAFLDVVITFN